MTIKELATMLNGREYGSELINIEDRQALELGFVVVFGYSDDGVEFRGAINDELGAYNGTVVYLSPDGLFEARSLCPRHNGDEIRNECEFIKQKQSLCKKITAVWCGDKGYSWHYETDIPHETFDIMEDGQKFCRGIVFDLNNMG